MAGLALAPVVIFPPGAYCLGAKAAVGDRRTMPKREMIISRLLVRCTELRKELRLGDYVIVKEDHDRVPPSVRAPIPARGKTPVLLNEDPQGIRHGERLGHRGATVARSVEHDDDLEAVRVV